MDELAVGCELADFKSLSAARGVDPVLKLGEGGPIYIYMYIYIYIYIYIVFSKYKNIYCWPGALIFK